MIELAMFFAAKKSNRADTPGFMGLALGALLFVAALLTQNAISTAFASGDPNGATIAIVLTLTQGLMWLWWGGLSVACSAMSFRRPGDHRWAWAGLIVIMAAMLVTAAMDYVSALGGALAA